VADLTSRCVGLKEEGAADREEARRLRAEVLDLNAEASHHEEVLQWAQEGLQAVTEELRWVQEGLLTVTEERNSLTKSLEDERSASQALNTWIKGVSLSFSLRV
jgi:chromosome segregation ATPase